MPGTAFATEVVGGVQRAFVTDELVTIRLGKTEFGLPSPLGEPMRELAAALPGHDQTIVITNPDASVTFDFEIKHGELFLNPVVPSCVKIGCWDAQWAVAVASPGHPWRRNG